MANELAAGQILWMVLGVCKTPWIRPTRHAAEVGGGWRKRQLMAGPVVELIASGVAVEAGVGVPLEIRGETRGECRGDRRDYRPAAAAVVTFFGCCVPHELLRRARESSSAEPVQRCEHHTGQVRGSRTHDSQIGEPVPRFSLRSHYEAVKNWEGHLRDR